MNFRLGVFDVFATAVPGAQILSLVAYVVWRNSVDLSYEALNNLNSIALLVVLFFVSHQVGLLMYPLGGWLTQFWRREISDIARQDFRERHPAFADRAFIDADKFLLLGAIEVSHPSVAQEVLKTRAQGVMLRSSSVAFVAAIPIAIVEIFVSGRPMIALGSALVLATVAVLARLESNRRTQWAYSLTLELAAWIPDIDAKLTAN